MLQLVLALLLLLLVLLLLLLQELLRLLLVLQVAYPLMEPLWLEVQTTTLTGTTLPSDVKQLRIVYVSDIHESSWPFFTHGRVVELVRKINAMHADLVLLGGDYATDSESAIHFFENLPTIQAAYGVYGVLGNHDRTAPESNLARLRTAMRTAKVTPLVNEVASVRIGTTDIRIAGLDDMNNGWPELKAVASAVRQDDFVIFLSHSPEIIPEALNTVSGDKHRNWYDLGLFGHTHGGQISGLGQLLGISKVSGRYERGWIVENKINMLISQGVGTSVLPMRLFCRPQIHLITVKSGK